MVAVHLVWEKRSFVVDNMPVNLPWPMHDQVHQSTYQNPGRHKVGALVRTYNLTERIKVEPLARVVNEEIKDSILVVVQVSKIFSSQQGFPMASMQPDKSLLQISCPFSIISRLR